MKVLMFGWEFPPFISGGLGTACYGLTKAMSELGTEVLFVLPRPVDASHSSHVTVLSPEGSVIRPPPKPDADRMRIMAPDAELGPYARPEDVADPARWVEERLGLPVSVGAPGQSREKPGSVIPGHYAGDLFSEVDRYARTAFRLIRGRSFDVIHAHDWMTYRAGIAVGALTGKPLVVHVHSTEFDRSGEHVNQQVYDIEWAGMHHAAQVITVSHLTKNIVVHRYGVDPERVNVVYNAIDVNRRNDPTFPPIRRNEKIVLFLGRITMQKGPEYFIAAANKVLHVMGNVRFIVAGSGDLAGRAIEMAAREGIGRKVLFTGFLRGKDVERVFRMADLYVMPSVSEPFGLVALEALSYDVPVIVSKQSGVSEVLNNVLKVDFWDVDKMANMILAVLRHPRLHALLRRHGRMEVSKFSWRDSANRCLEVYRKATRVGRETAD